METHTKHFIRAFALAIVGTALTFTIIGAIIGLPMIFIAVGAYAKAVEEKTGELPWWAQGKSKDELLGGDDRPWWTKSFLTLWRERKQ